MAHYAKVVNGVVDKVIVADAEFFENNVDTSPGSWIQTSYNTRGNVHYGQDGQPDGGVALRGNYAGIGYTYDSFNDVFIPPKPFYSWVLNTSTWTWEAPVPMPVDGNMYYWDENAQQWVILANPV